MEMSGAVMPKVAMYNFCFDEFGKFAGYLTKYVESQLSDFVVM
jgi:hypothetical protein